MDSAIRKIAQALRPVDVLVLAFDVLVTLLLIVLSGSIHPWGVLCTVNIVVGIVILLLAFKAQNGKSSLTRFVYEWYPVPLIFFSFKEMYLIIQSSSRMDYDWLLIAIDRWMFGADPTVWVAQYTTPWLTEVLQIAYASFYFIMLAVGIELYAKRRYEEFSNTLFTILYGFFLSYLGYLIFPGVGPRFTLHDFHALDTELPGIFLTTPIRDFINAGESIPKGAVNALALAQRDVFPSGHTEMTLISIYLAIRYRLASRYVLCIAGTLLIIATVYLRYHYVVDLIGGAIVMMFTIWTAAPMIRKWETFRGQIRTSI